MSNIYKPEKISWADALDTLSHGAFYLLAILLIKELYVTDEALMKLTGTGISTHRKYKRELMSYGYLTVEQVGKGEYQYTIGEPNV